MSDETPTSDTQAIEAASTTDGRSMHVKVYSPFKVYFEGTAESVSAESATGPFDILPKHHNFITLLDPCDLIIRTGKDEEQAIAIQGGIMHVKADEVIVFLDV
jgi:F-type H+-transporting ATPase subunit epsilon